MRHIFLIMVGLVAWATVSQAKLTDSGSLNSSTEPGIAFNYGYSFGPYLLISLTLMNDSATIRHPGFSAWPESVSAQRDSLRASLGDSLMAITVVVINYSVSRDTLTFPGDAEICIVHDGEYVTPVRPTPDRDVVPGHREFFYFVFRKYPMVLGDTLAIRPKESP